MMNLLYQAYDMVPGAKRCVRRICTCLCAVVCCVLASASGGYLFTPVDVGSGLSDKALRSIIRLPDGRMVFVTETLANVCDGVSRESYDVCPESGVCRLAGYTGFTHLYCDNDSLLWYKNHGRLSCIDWRSGKSISLGGICRLVGPEQGIDDFFVDNRGDRWIRRGDKLISDKGMILLSGDGGKVQDMARDERCIYVFFSDGRVDAFDAVDCKRLYSKAAYDSSEIHDFDNTSLVVAAPGGFYQLRNGRNRGVLLYFDTALLQWSRLLDVDYTLNTLALAPDGKIWVSCRRGIWIVDSAKDEAVYLDYLHVASRGSLTTEISTVYIDTTGGVWLGTFDRGVLYTNPGTYEAVSIPLHEELRRSMPSGFFENRDGRVFLCYGDSAYLIDAEQRALVPSGTDILDFGHTGYSGTAFSASDGTEYFLESDAVAIFSMPDSSNVLPDAWTSAVVSKADSDIADASVHGASTAWLRTLGWILAILLTVGAGAFLVRRFVMARRRVGEDAASPVVDEPVLVLDEAMNESDKEFLSRATEMVERNIAVAGYTVERLSRDLCMDRTGLYRKLVALLDKSPSLFIRSVRLKRAAEIIEEHPDMNVAEIAEMTGFSGSSYFSKCFYEEFGCRPSEYASKHRKST